VVISLIVLAVVVIFLSLANQVEDFNRQHDHGGSDQGR